MPIIQFFLDLFQFEAGVVVALPEAKIVFDKGGLLYKADRSGTKLKGRRTGRQFRVGSLIKVSVEKVDLIKKRVDFLIA